MHRRDFIGLAGGTAALLPIATRAQQAKLPRIGVLVLGNPAPEAFLESLRDGLRSRGYSEDVNIKLEIRSAERKIGLLPEIAAELVRLKVDVIVAFQTPSAQAASQATRDIPIVMASVGDPVGTGLIASLARPGGNITGNTAGGDASGKTVQFIREALPSARRAGVLVNAPDPFSKSFLGQVEPAARALGIELDVAMTTPSEDPDGHFEAFIRNKSEAVIIQPSLLRPVVVELALKHRLPSFAPHRSLPLSGGMLSYSGIDTDQWREVGLYIDRILKGARPADLPVALPTRYELIVNLKTANALGLTLPPFLLARADTVIE